MLRTAVCAGVGAAFCLLWGACSGSGVGGGAFADAGPDSALGGTGNVGGTGMGGTGAGGAGTGGTTDSGEPLITYCVTGGSSPSSSCSCETTSPTVHPANSDVCGPAQIQPPGAICCATPGWPDQLATTCSCVTYGCLGDATSCDCAVGEGPETSCPAPSGGICCTQDDGLACECTQDTTCTPGWSPVPSCSVSTAVCGKNYTLSVRVATCR